MAERKVDRAQEARSLRETKHFLRSQNNAERLLRTLANCRGRRFSMKELESLLKKLGFE